MDNFHTTIDQDLHTGPVTGLANVCPCCKRSRKNWIKTPLGKACHFCMIRYATPNVIVALYGETILRRYVESHRETRLSQLAERKSVLVGFIIERARIERRRLGWTPIAEQALLKGLPTPVGLTAKEIRGMGLQVRKSVDDADVFVRDEHTWTGYIFKNGAASSIVEQAKAKQRPPPFGKSAREIRALGYTIVHPIPGDFVLAPCVQVPDVEFFDPIWVEFVRDEVSEGRVLDAQDGLIAAACGLWSRT